MASLVAPCSALHPRGSSAAPSSFFRAQAPSRADRVCFDPSRVLMQADASSSRDCKRRRRHGGDDDSRASKKQAVGRAASPVAHLSCARIRPFVRTPCPKQETRVTARAVRGDVISKKNACESLSCKNIEPAVPAPSRPKKETSSSTHGFAHGVITMQKAGQKVSCTRIRPTVAKMKVLGNDAHGEIKTKQEASERAQATVTKIIPPSAPSVNHQDPYAPQDAVRAALAAARQALNRRQNFYGRQREEARRELAKMVQTVFFNDPYISLDDVLKP
ncbi:unnamed protein product [Alopecurus aequalis]